LKEDSINVGRKMTVFGIFANNCNNLSVMFIKIGDLKPPDYKGIKVLAAYGLHSDIFEIVNPYLKKGMNILDFGCGQGAFSQRLIDAGMIVDGCDIDTDQIKAHIHGKIKLDLNKAEVLNSIPNKYDMVVAIEILEHLNNPWKYLGDCLSVLKDGGIIVLSTPNISSFPSRLRFFMRGSLLAYEKTDLAHGHITPLSYVQLENMFNFYKIDILKKGHAGTIPFFHLFGISTFSAFRNLILPFFYPFMTGPKRGRSLVYILRKN
jgi:2-polyprenyl-3-methyl-5-hydroxy-6-metoxy-1,4-benzoquinol methylase